MKAHKRLLLAPLMTVILASCSSLQDGLIHRSMENQVKKLAKDSQYTTNKDAITVVTLGTASPLPGDRAQTGTAVFANGHFFLFDVGAGVVQKIENFNLPWDKFDGIFITHYHSDHVMDLSNAINRSWQRGRKIDLMIYGPQGLNDLVQTANDFNKLDKIYRVEHHGSETMNINYADGIPNEFYIEPFNYKKMYHKDGITITAFSVTHNPIEPAVGYKIEYKGKKVIISGDTKKNELLTKMSENADLLVHEAMLMDYQNMLSEVNRENGQERNVKILTDIQDYHTSPSGVAEIANEAHVKEVVLNHLGPAPFNRILKNKYLKQMKTYQGKVHLANDGDVYIVK